MLTHESVREILHYNAKTGEFTWLKHFRSPKIGKVAGCMNKLGYHVIRYLNRDYYAHRLAFLWMAGEMPDIVDHIDGNTSNNAWNNLRPATKSQNNFNRRPRLSSKGLPNGITPCLAKYAARLYKDGKAIHVGVFDTVEEAVAARTHLAKQLYGEFVRG